MHKSFMKKFILCLLLTLTLPLCSSGCGLVETEYVTDTPEDHRVRVILEEDNSFYADEYVQETKTGGDVTFILHEVCGRKITGTDFRGETTLVAGQVSVGQDPTGQDPTGQDPHEQNETEQNKNRQKNSGQQENTKILTVKNVRYSTVISVQSEQETCEVTYHANGGHLSNPPGLEASPDEDATQAKTESTGLSPSVTDTRTSENSSRKEDSDSSIIKRTVPHTHPRVNTARADELFQRDGFTLIGWSTSPTGEDFVSPGSRIDYAETVDLYAVWVPWTDESAFSYETSGDGVIITGFAEKSPRTETSGDGVIITGFAEQSPRAENSRTDSLSDLPAKPFPAATLSIPAAIAGRPVYGIATDAFADAPFTTLVLPPGLRTVENGAFRGAKLREVYLFDDLTTISGHAFDKCPDLRTLHLGAAREPVYSGNYFDTFADKCDRLRRLRHTPKIVLFSGSSTRFGYDSRRIEEAMGRSVVNMGVFAYTNAFPQLLIMQPDLRAEDILLVSPELDAAQSQFCVSRQMEPQIYAMCESDYALLERIDLAEVTNAFGALNTFLENRRGMEKKNYDITAADFDEDGKPVTTPSYNEYGDYILFRPNAETEEPVYGLGVDYTTAALPKAQFIDPFNRVMQMFLAQGIDVCFTYSPRNVLALSESSTEAARTELDRYLRSNLTVPVISDIEESLYTGTYLYGTDNHLSTEGVQIRTERVIADLQHR